VHMVSVIQNVRFIFVKRDLEDNLLRIFMRKYRSRNVYGYDLKAARDYILWYHEMMDLMAEKFPNLVRIFNYEDIVANPAASLRFPSNTGWVRTLFCNHRNAMRTAKATCGGLPRNTFAKRVTA